MVVHLVEVGVMFFLNTHRVPTQTFIVVLYMIWLRLKSSGREPALDLVHVAPAGGPELLTGLVIPVMSQVLHLWRYLSQLFLGFYFILRYALAFYLGTLKCRRNLYTLKQIVIPLMVLSARKAEGAGTG